MRRMTLLLGLLLALAVPAAAAGPVGEAASSPEQDFVLPQPIEPLPEPLATAVAGIGAPALATHIRVLASPSMEGRGLGDRGLDAAIEYVTASLSLAGIAAPDGGDPAAGPGAAGRFQVVPLREITNQEGAVTVARRSGEQSWSRSFTAGVDCLLPYLAPQSITAPVVFAGHGIREPGLGHDDYRGLDVRGSIVLLFAGLPAGLPELDAALRRAAIANGLALHFDRTDGTFGGSDYRDFARAGVPFIRFFGNFFPAYHEPGDTAEALDAEQVQRVSRLALATAWLLADR